MFDFFPVCYVLPHRDTLGVTILDRNYDADMAENARLLSLPGIDAFGLAITTDGATIQRHSMMNIMALGVVFLVFYIASR